MVKMNGDWILVAADEWLVVPLWRALEKSESSEATSGLTSVESLSSSSFTPSLSCFMLLRALVRDRWGLKLKSSLPLLLPSFFLPFRLSELADFAIESLPLTSSRSPTPPPASSFSGVSVPSKPCLARFAYSSPSFKDICLILLLTTGLNCSFITSSTSFNLPTLAPFALAPLSSAGHVPFPPLPPSFLLFFILLASSLTKGDQTGRL